MLTASTRAVVFDVVGTLLHPRPPALEMYWSVGKELGLELAPTQLRERFLAAFQAEEQFDQSLSWITSEGRERERWQRIVATTLAGISQPELGYQQLYEHFARPESWVLATDTQEVLSELKTRGLSWGLGSNYDSRLWSVLEGFPELALPRDRVLISSVVGFRKPAPEFFRALCQCFQQEPGAILFIGDDYRNDYLGARQAGLQSVLLGDDMQIAATTPCIARLRELLTC